MKVLVALVIFFGLLGCEKRALSNEERAGNFVIAWLGENGLQGDYPSLTWRVEKNKGQHENGWNCQYVFRVKKTDKTGAVNNWIQSTYDINHWRDWAIVEREIIEENSFWFLVRCPFRPMRWRVYVVQSGDGFRVSDVKLWDNKGDLRIRLVEWIE
ncbi:MAG: hypothetical protein AAF514_12905 [Verrucomicrobiota bacterium]